MRRLSHPQESPSVEEVPAGKPLPTLWPGFLLLGGVGVFLSLGGLLAQRSPHWLWALALALYGGVAGGGLWLLRVEKAWERERQQVQRAYQRWRARYVEAVEERQRQQERGRRTQLLADLGYFIATAPDLEGMLGLVLRKVCEALGARSGFFLLRQEDDTLTVEASYSSDEKPTVQGVLRVGEGYIGQVAATGTPLLLSGDEKEAKGQTAIFLPLFWGKRVIGVVGVEESLSGRFTEADMDFLKSVTVHLAAAIDRAMLHRQVHRMAIMDELTQVYNRRYLNQRLREEVRRAKRSRRPLTILLLDIDHFKTFNDTYGHLVGDAVLRDLAQILSRTVRETDLVARYGGEEFCIVAFECNLEQAKVLAERLQAAIRATPVAADMPEGPLTITVSMGLASLPEDGEDERVLLERADEALYHAKQTGRNRFCAWREMEKALH